MRCSSSWFSDAQVRKRAVEVLAGLAAGLDLPADAREVLLDRRTNVVVPLHSLPDQVCRGVERGGVRESGLDALQERHHFPQGRFRGASIAGRFRIDRRWVGTGLKWPEYHVPGRRRALPVRLGFLGGRGVRRGLDRFATHRHRVGGRRNRASAGCRVVLHALGALFVRRNREQQGAVDRVALILGPGHLPVSRQCRHRCRTGCRNG